MALSKDKQEQLARLRDSLLDKAKMFGVTVQEAAADEITALHGTARTAIIRAAVASGAVGVGVGFTICMVLVK